MPIVLNHEILKANLDKHFGDIEYPRVERTRAYYLVDIIVIVLCLTIGD
jgi:hypothetical protein